MSTVTTCGCRMQSSGCRMQRFLRSSFELFALYDNGHLVVSRLYVQSTSMHPLTHLSLQDRCFEQTPHLFFTRSHHAPGTKAAYQFAKSWEDPGHSVEFKTTSTEADTLAPIPWDDQRLKEWFVTFFTYLTPFYQTRLPDLRQKLSVVLIS